MMKRAQEHKSTIDFCTYALMTCALMLAGCAKQQQYEAVEPICVPDMNMAEAMQITEDILATMHFTIEKADLKNGLLRTRPLPGAQFFEFWRSDNIRAFNCAEANLHSIRRIVELHINQQFEKLCIDCGVKVQRLSLPECQVSNGAQAYRMFSQSTPSVQKLKLNSEQKAAMAWIDLGRDARLATEILKRIEQQIVTCTPSTISHTSDESRATRDKK